MVGDKLWVVGLLDSPRANELMIQSFNNIAVSATETYALLDEVAIEGALRTAPYNRVSTRLSKPYELQSADESVQLYAVHKDFIQTVEQYGIPLPGSHWVLRGEVHGITSAVLRRSNDDGSSDVGTAIRRDATTDWLIFEDPSKQSLLSYQRTLYPMILGVVRSFLEDNDDESIMRLAQSHMMQFDWSASLDTDGTNVLYEFLNRVWGISGKYHPWFEACDSMMEKRPAGYAEALRKHYGQKVPRIAELNITEFRNWVLYDADGRLERVQ